MKKKIQFGVVMIVILGVVILVLANIKSPESSKNLLSYWFFHSKSWSCRIVQQEYNELKNYNYDEDCVGRLCEINNPPKSESKGVINWGAEACISWAEKGEYSDSLQDCVIDYETTQEFIFAEISGQQEKHFYFGIPILKESCPKGYSVQ